MTVKMKTGTDASEGDDILRPEEESDSDSDPDENRNREECTRCSRTREIRMPSRYKDFIVE